MGSNKVSTSGKEILPAILRGQVQTALVAQDRTAVGHLDGATGELAWGGDGADGTDALNEIAALALLHGGEAHALPAAAMPGGAEVVALFRY